MTAPSLPALVQSFFTHRLILSDGESLSVEDPQMHQNPNGMTLPWRRVRKQPHSSEKSA